MKGTFVFIIFIFSTLFLFSQNIAVQSFRPLENDLEALVRNPVIDMSNGEKAALIKVVTTETGFDFGGGQLGIVKVVYKTAEIWVYVPAKLKAITIAHPKYGQLPGRYYVFPVPIESAKVYEMILVTGRIETTVKPIEVETQWLIINTDPAGADVYINDQPAGQTPYQNELPLGKYTFHIKKELYQDDYGFADLVAGQDKKKIDVKLKPNYGTLNISSTPENNAAVSLNGLPTGKTTPCTIEMVPAGDHKITLRLDMYETTTTAITLAAGQTLPVKVSMNPTFAEITINTEPMADVYINGQFKANGQWKGRLVPAIYTFEARLDKYYPATEKQTVKVGEPLTLTLKPQPKNGSLKIVTTPFEAAITLNGKDYGTSPATIKNLLIGSYTLVLKKAGYGDVTKTIAIEENKTTELNETLPSGMEVNITSSPSGAQLSIDGVAAGTTPYKATLAFGSHTLKLVNGKKAVTETINLTQGGKSSFAFDVAEFGNFTETYAGLNLEMIAVTGGTFTMGSSNSESDESPPHTVSVGNFYMGKYEVTQAQWYAVMKNSPSRFGNCNNCPVENVSWNDIQEFLQKLNRGTGKNYRLPTEAEWEYAAKGGQGYTYAGSDNIDQVAWYDGNSGSKTHPVGQKKPNGYGLYDMTGNVWEWCSDWYSSDYYESSPAANPQGPSSGSDRVLRGGSWGYDAQDCRVANRIFNGPDCRDLNGGFRVVCVP